jgi:hypothetical protein
MNADRRVEFLQELVEENAWIQGSVLYVGYDIWAIHGIIAVDGDVLMAEFESYDQAKSALDEVRSTTRGHQSSNAR